jgi:hypothetical protein
VTPLTDIGRPQDYTAFDFQDFFCGAASPLGYAARVTFGPDDWGGIKMLAKVGALSHALSAPMPVIFNGSNATHFATSIGGS